MDCRLHTLCPWPALPESLFMPGSAVNTRQQSWVASEPAGSVDWTRYSATTGLVSDPSPSTVTVTVSPGLSQRLGVRPRPTPGGVPVEIMSPASMGVIDEIYSISSGILNTSSLVLELCNCSPSMVSPMCSTCGSGISSAVTMAGPSGQNVGKHFDSDHCVEAN